MISNLVITSPSARCHVLAQQILTPDWPLISPFGQVAGEVAAEADDAPVFPVVDAVEGLLVGQVHLGTTRHSLTWTSTTFGCTSNFLIKGY